MKTRVSALMDGELDEHETDDLLRSLSKDSNLRGQWADFHLIGEAMRDESRLEMDVTARVMAALEQEPTILLPSARRRASRWRPLAALAASVAGVALVAWVGLGSTSGQPGLPLNGSGTQSLASAAPAAPLATTSVATNEASLQDYLVAHHMHASTAAVANGTRYVRIVSMEREGR